MPVMRAASIPSRSMIRNAATIVGFPLAMVQHADTGEGGGLAHEAVVPVTREIADAIDDRLDPQALSLAVTPAPVQGRRDASPRTGGRL